MKTIYQTPDIGKITVIKSILESSGIQCILLDEYSQLVNQSTLLYSGGGRLAVADEQETEARAVIKDYLETAADLKEEDPGKEEKKLSCPECGSREFAPAFWSIFFGGNKYKCKKCGMKFQL